MGLRRLSALVTSVALMGLVWPSSGVANHVGVQASVSAETKRFGPDSWLVTVRFTVSCQGVGPAGASYQGNLYLTLDTGEEIYLGGVAGASGEVDQLVHSTDRWQRFAPRLKVSCLDNETLHGSGNIEVGGATGIGESGEALVPPRQRLPRGGGGGGTGWSGDPTEPLRSEGCLTLLVGTAQADDLLGTPKGEVVFGLGKGDRIRGAGGHDCLIGGPGADTLLGQDGWDRLTGGPGPDRLVGGPGLNGYDGGPGRDFVDAVNGKRELVRCGSGRDRAKADPSDDLSGCEVVSRVRSQGS